MTGIYVVTDTHYLSRKVWDTDPYSVKRITNQLQLRESKEIIEEAFDMIKADSETGIVLVLGDLTHCGDEYSHKEFIALLRDLKESGKRVYAFPAGHDYPEGNRRIHVDANGNIYETPAPFTRDEVIEMYKEFGYNEAPLKDKNSGSFAVPLDGNILLMMLELSKNVGDPESPQTAFVKETLAYAKENGLTVIGGGHYPIIAPNPIYSKFGMNGVYVTGAAEMYAENGIKLFFTGHSHIHDISKYENGKGGFVYDITTGATAGYPPYFRKVVFDTEKNTADISTIEIETLSRFDLKGKTLADYSKETFLDLIKQLLAEMPRDAGKFCELALTVDSGAAKLQKFKPLIKPIGKYINSITFGKIGDKTRKKTGLSKEEYAHLRNKRAADFVFEQADCMFTGKVKLTENDPEYKIAMAYIERLDKKISHIKKINLKKLIGTNSLAEFLRPVFLGNSIDNYNLKVNLNNGQII